MTQKIRELRMQFQPEATGDDDYTELSQVAFAPTPASTLFID